MKTDAPNKIRPIGQVLDSERSIELGNSLLPLFEKYDRLLNFTIGPAISLMANVTHHPGEDNSQTLSDSEDSALFPNSNIVRTSKSAERYLRESMQVASAVAKREVSEDIDTYMIENSFVLGATGRWHIDADRNLRMLVNLSEFPITLQIATEYPVTEGSLGYRLPDFDSPSFPIESGEIVYGPGEAVIVDNLCNVIEQQPHRGTTRENRVILRTDVTPTIKSDI
jgi:hypothetical protein